MLLEASIYDATLQIYLNKENTLINQQFIKDSKISISQYIKGFSDSVEVTDFSRVGI